jgi:hypothetical protein
MYAPHSHRPKHDLLTHFQIPQHEHTKPQRLLPLPLHPWQQFRGLLGGFFDRWETHLRGGICGYPIWINLNAEA